MVFKMRVNEFVNFRKNVIYIYGVFLEILKCVGTYLAFSLL